MSNINKNCNAELNNRVKFCTNCGAPVEVAKTETFGQQTQFENPIINDEPNFAGNDFIYDAEHPTGTLSDEKAREIADKLFISMYSEENLKEYAHLHKIINDL